MTTSNAAADKTADKAGAGKTSEKLAEKRRALGRGLESLLPGPRVVVAASTLPQSAGAEGAPGAARSQVSAASFLDGGASSALAPCVNTATLTGLPVPLGRTLEPRTT